MGQPDDHVDSASDQRVRELFDRILALPDGERDAGLQSACGDDPAMMQRVASLLTAHAKAGVFLQQATVGLDAMDRARRSLSMNLADQRVGNYQPLQLIGEGGMGAVYLAEQERPVRRRVALKVIKLGMDTDRVIARFEQERQALAVMDHPHIAKVLEAGSTATGRPYFVMELVEGVPITQYCDDARLTPRQRLELFVPICQAVQHAHQKGIIHRDLKPSNVLVTVSDGKPIPKVIDFGIAKAVESRLTEKTQFTEFRQMIGTPEYMSPEQAEGSAIDIDTRSDVYALGAAVRTVNRHDTI